jgi:hypothetical protein
LGNREVIAAKLEQKAGPQARSLFERFVRDVQALEAERASPGLPTKAD